MAVGAEAGEREQDTFGSSILPLNRKRGLSFENVRGWHGVFKSIPK